MKVTISFIFFIIMTCYALYINYSWSKYCDEINDEWAKRYIELNNKWTDVYNSIIKEKENGIKDKNNYNKNC